MVVSLGRGRHTIPPRLLAYSFLTLVFLAGACEDGPVEAGDVLPATPIPEAEDPGLVHIHGLGINPADDDLYIATHFGLWRLRADQLERVGEAYHDLMGFSVAGPDRFLASGHPLLVEDRLPPHLGLIETTDGGETWRSVSLLGEVDFHALRYAHDRVYGWDSTTATFMRSADGREWERLAEVGLLDFVVDPADPDTLLAGIQDGAGGVVLARSDDGGATFEPSSGTPGGRLAWSAPDRLWLVDLGGTVSRSRDGGRTWEATGQLNGLPEAFIDAGDRLYAAEHGALLVSPDGSAWEVAHPGH